MSEETKITDSSGENSLWAMVRDFYNLQMLPFIIVIWAFAIILIAGAVWSGIEFCKSEEVKNQIMFAGIFVCCVQFTVLLKVVSWQFIHRNGIMRQIRKLQAQIDELSEKIKEH